MNTTEYLLENTNKTPFYNDVKKIFPPIVIALFVTKLNTFLKLKIISQNKTEWEKNEQLYENGNMFLKK